MSNTITFYIDDKHAFVEFSQAFSLYENSNPRNFIGLTFYDPTHIYADKQGIEPSIFTDDKNDIIQTMFDPNKDLSIRSKGSVVKKTFTFTDEEYASALARVKTIAQDVKDGKTKYFLNNNNCIDFAQDIWGATGRKGAWTNYINPSEMVDLADNVFNYTNVKTYATIQYGLSNSFPDWGGARFAETGWSVTLYTGETTTLEALIKNHAENENLLKKVFIDDDGKEKVLLTSEDILFDGKYSWKVVPQNSVNSSDFKPLINLYAVESQGGNILMIDDAEGSASTFLATDQDDYIVGTEYDERIIGKGGNDTIIGGDGNDTLTGSGSFTVGNSPEVDILVDYQGANTFVLGTPEGDYYNHPDGFYGANGERLTPPQKNDYAVIPYHDSNDVFALSHQHKYYQTPIANTFMNELGYSEEKFNPNYLSRGIVADLDDSGDISAGDSPIAILGGNHNLSDFSPEGEFGGEFNG